jgi:hypothetical protein
VSPDAGHVHEHLGQAVHDRRQLHERGLRLRHPRQQVEGGEDAVAGRRVVEHDDVPGLLAAQREPAAAHLLEHVAVADSGGDRADAALPHRQLQAQVAHHGDDERVVGQVAALGERQREDRHHVVAVHHPAGVVDREAAVGVAVQGDAGGRAVGDDGLAQAVQVRGAVAVVDVEAVRLRTDHGDVGAGLAQRPRRDLAGGAVRAVDDDAQPVEPVRRRGEQAGDVAVRGVREAAHPADAGAGGALPGLVEAPLDGVLDLVRQLVPAAREDLDPVVRHRVVRGGEHDAEVRGGARHQRGDGRRRQHAGVVDVHPGAGQPGDHGRGQELAGGARVAADDGARPVALERAALAEDVSRGDRDAHRQLGRQVAVRETADAVGAEESSHGLLQSFVLRLQPRRTLHGGSGGFPSGTCEGPRTT